MSFMSAQVCRKKTNIFSLQFSLSNVFFFFFGTEYKSRFFVNLVKTDGKERKVGEKI